MCIMTLYFITGNKNKLIEAQHLIPSIKQLDIEVEEIQSNDPQSIIKHKLEQACKHSQETFFVEDTSVYFPALNMFPGPNIKWMVTDMGIEKIAELVHKYEDRTMIVKACIGLHVKGVLTFFEGTVTGTCVKPQGDGHGFTPMFQPEGHSITFAQMTPDQKSQVSHRSLAVNQMKTFLQKQE